MSRRKFSTTVCLTPEQDERLHALSKATRIPIAELIRQGIDLALVYEMAKHPDLRAATLGKRAEGA